MGKELGHKNATHFCQPIVFCATLFTVHSSLQMSEAVSNAVQIWISAVLCKFGSNYVCITELWNKSVCCGMWIHIPLLFLSIIVFSVCWVFISCGLFFFSLFLFFFFFNETPFLFFLIKIKKIQDSIFFIVFLKAIWVAATDRSEVRKEDCVLCCVMN